MPSHSLTTPKSPKHKVVRKMINRPVLINKDLPPLSEVYEKYSLESSTLFNVPSKVNNASK